MFYTIKNYDKILEEELKSYDININIPMNSPISDLLFIEELKICTKRVLTDKIQVWSTDGKKYYTYNKEKLCIFLEWLHCNVNTPLKQGYLLPYNCDFCLEIKKGRSEDNIITMYMDGCQSAIEILDIDVKAENFHELIELLPSAFKEPEPIKIAL